MIVENTEFDPVPASLPAGAGGVIPPPPAPTEIGYVVTETGRPPGAFNGEVV